MGFHNASRPQNPRAKNAKPGGPLRPIFHDESGDQKPDYKTAALCKQVRRILSLALAGECGDPILQDLIVEEVLPAPNAGRLLVVVLLRARESGPTLIDVLTRLDHVHGLLRSKIAEAIARKRTPELTFDVRPILPPSITGEEVSHD